MIDQYQKWREALATNSTVLYELGNPASGFYRVRARNKDRSIRHDAVAIWRDQDGIQCARTGPFSAQRIPTKSRLYSSHAIRARFPTRCITRLRKADHGRMKLRR